MLACTGNRNNYSRYDIYSANMYIPGIIQNITGAFVLNVYYVIVSDSMEGRKCITVGHASLQTTIVHILRDNSKEIIADYLLPACSFYIHVIVLKVRWDCLVTGVCIFRAASAVKLLWTTLFRSKCTLVVWGQKIWNYLDSNSGSCIYVQ